MSCINFVSVSVTAQNPVLGVTSEEEYVMEERSISFIDLFYNNTDYEYDDDNDEFSKQQKKYI